MTGNGDQRALEPPGHVLDKAGLATTSRAFENHRQAGGMGGFEEIKFPTDGQVVRLFGDSIFFNG